MASRNSNQAWSKSSACAESRDVINIAMSMAGSGRILIWPTLLMFVDPCIIVQFIKKNPTRCNNVLKFYYSMFIWNSTCFGWHTAHHQEPKTTLAASGFSYVKGYWTCSWWTLSGTDTRTVPDNVHQLYVQQPSTYEKPEAANAGLSSWCWAVCRPKHVEFHIIME